MIDAIYDVKKRRFKQLVVPITIFTASFAIVFVIGVVFGLPNMIFPSLMAVVLSIITLVHDHWILNSIITPLSFVFWIVSGVDLAHLNVYLLVVHLPTAVISTIVMFRGSSSLVVMYCSSVIYTAWIFTINYWDLFGAYDCILGICNPFVQAVVIFTGCAVISTVVYAKNYVLVKKGKLEPDCDGGICPW